MKIKKTLTVCTSILMAVILSVPSVSPLNNIKKVNADSGQSSWGQFATWYGQDYQRRQKEKEENKKNNNTNADTNNGYPPLPEKGTYGWAQGEDAKTAVVNVGKYLLSEGVKDGVSYWKNIDNYKELEKLNKQLEGDIKNSLTRKRHKNSIVNKTKKKIGKVEDKIGGVKSKVGTGVNVAMCVWGLYDMYDKPDVGYKSPFYEFCANSIRGMSAVSNVILPEGSVYYSLAEEAATSEILKKYLNDGYTEPGPLDRWVDNFNKYYQSCFEEWFFKKELKTVEENNRLAEIYERICRGASCTANGVNVYKPNIYLYPEKEQAVTVKFKMPELLTVTEPVYNNCWKVVASPDGSITDLKDDGGKYGYLFYESLTMPTGWQKEEGFVIPKDNRKETFTGILTAYGLNEKEIADFNEFWCDKLEEGKDYYMYPQMTEVIDERMPVDIKPAPDSIIRIWFAFDENDDPNSEPKITKFERDGFSVVEWGGFILK